MKLQNSACAFIKRVLLSLGVVVVVFVVFIACSILIADAADDDKYDATFTPNALNGKIAFITNRNGSGEIFTMNADGSNQTNITNTLEHEDQPEWSADGTKIVFAIYDGSRYDIHSMNADGSNRVRLTNNGSRRPSWSPDGTKIVFAYAQDIYLMNSDGTNQIRLGTNALYDDSPKFSPDGSRIVFLCSRPFNGKPPTVNDDVCVMNADGSNEINLTHHPAADYGGRFSPDGSKIAFNSNRVGPSEIYLMNADGSNPVNLSNNPAHDFIGAWSPDGSKIAFSTSRNGANNDEIYTMNADGMNQTRVTNNTTHDTSPTWQRVPSTAQVVSVSGRITTPSGLGINKVYVNMSDANGNVMNAISSSFGYYRFDNVLLGETYVISVVSKRYTFPISSRTLTITGELVNVDFVSEE